MLPEIIINNRLWNVGGVIPAFGFFFSSEDFAVLQVMLYAPYDQMFQMNPGSGDWTGHKMWTNRLLLVFINTAQFFPLIWPCAPFSFTCLWCPSAAFIAFICPWGQTEGSQSAPSVVRWEGNGSIYLAYLRMFAWGVYSMCVARTGRCARTHSECLCHGFRFLWVILRICISCYVLYVCLVSVALSLSSVGVCPVLIGFTCILFIFFPLVSACLFVSVSFSLWRVPAFFFLAPILFCIVGASEHTCTAPHADGGELSSSRARYTP